MFAIIETGSKQYMVSAGDKVKVEKLVAEGDSVVFDKVMLVGDGGDARVGTPYVSGARVEARILKQAKAQKVIVFKYHHKSRYRKKRGHRQPFTEVEIIKITS